MMTRSALAAVLLLWACGGSSERVDGEDGDSNGGRAGSSGGSTAARGGATAATGGGDGAVGATAAVGAMGAVGATGAASGDGGSSDGPCGPGGCIGGTTTLPPIDPPGPVFCNGVECNAPAVCCMTTGFCYDPVEPEACETPPPDDDPWGRRPCNSNAQCGEREFCMLDSGLCQGSGHCNPIGNCGGCFGEGDNCRVCGCDGNDYPDQQTACLARANVVNGVHARCGEAVDVGGGGSGGAVQRLTPCGNDDQCSASDLCCPITGLCYPESDAGRCRTPPDGTRFPCTSNDQCYEGEYCAGEGCSGPGGCAQRDPEGDCGVVVETVCGCDGTTYTSAGCASSRGVRVAGEGACVSL